ncbi:tryptophan synthase, alpha chain [Acetitomaculum ruminis DSM 5522]|uniref:Tryptophan synthase alpha chain n=1 Tax=Acetitomaculum ruminis DSM 5522 TaxID=1120918 RepID=A0A1I0YKB8_9FIRM|nr:tryptophan synthase subunit alpha [Acetitomaculum ruminis]SFB13855.1 tryptophan synthase, alpha chain [Acetitomaculum ruminis DSM 5522]
MSNRIEEKIKELNNKGEKAFITYITAGLPDMKVTKKLIKAKEMAGIDIIELGIPFSDPTADGPVIQQASYEALLAGADINKTFTLVEELRKENVIVPIIFMLYYNTILSMGIEKFIEKCNKSGVDGLIIPDLPFEEQGKINAALAKNDETILIQLISPLSEDRIPMITENARGFIYLVSSMGVTGQSANFHKEIVNYIKKVKKASKIPVMMGFGIRTPKDLENVSDIIDGAIVGSHFINILRESDFNINVATEYIKDFKYQINHM